MRCYSPFSVAIVSSVKCLSESVTMVAVTSRAPLLPVSGSVARTLSPSLTSSILVVAERVVPVDARDVLTVDAGGGQAPGAPPVVGDEFGLAGPAFLFSQIGVLPADSFPASA